jgi:acetyltransferase-like isoleucine patch superfamily enzyme
MGEKEVGPVEIGAHTYVGPNTVIACGSRIGHHSRVGALSFVKGDFAPYSMIAGNPATLRKRLGETSLKHPT